MLDRQSYLLGVEDVVLLLKEQMHQVKDEKLKKFLADLIQEIEQKKIWLAKQRIFGY